MNDYHKLCKTNVNLLNKYENTFNKLASKISFNDNNDYDFIITSLNPDKLNSNKFIKHLNSICDELNMIKSKNYNNHNMSNNDIEYINKSINDSCIGFNDKFKELSKMSTDSANNIIIFLKLHSSKKHHNSSTNQAEHFNVKKLSRSIKKGTSKAINTVKKGTSKAVDTVKKDTSKAVDTVKKGTLKAVDTVKNTATSGINAVFDILKKIISMFEKILDQIKDIGKNIAIVMEDLFKKIFGIMLDVFKWIANELVPIMKTLIKYMVKFITVYLPQTVQYMYKFYVELFNSYVKIIVNFTKAPIPPPILFVIIFFGLQMFLKYITGLPSSIPPFYIAIFSLLLVSNQLYYNIDNLKIMNKWIIDFVCRIFNSSMIRILLGFTPSKKANTDKLLLFKEINAFISANFLKITLNIIVLMIIIRMALVWLGKKFTNYTGLE